MPRKRELKTTKRVREDLDFIVETQHHRLDQEMIKLKTSGVIPKNAKIWMTDMKNVATKIGLERLRTINFLEYQQIVKEMRGLEKILNKKNKKEK